MWLRIWAVVQKEFIQTFRDRRSLVIQIGLPIFQLILFAYAISMNVEHIPMIVADQSLDNASHSFVSAMTASGNSISWPTRWTPTRCFRQSMAGKPRPAL